MGSKGFIRVVEFLYALKMVIAAMNRLTASDLKVLDQIAAIMEQGDKDEQ